MLFQKKLHNMLLQFSNGMFKFVWILNISPSLLSPLPFSLSLSPFLPEGRDWLCFPIQYIQEAVNRQLIN